MRLLDLPEYRRPSRVRKLDQVTLSRWRRETSLLRGGKSFRETDSFGLDHDKLVLRSASSNCLSYSCLFAEHLIVPSEQNPNHEKVQPPLLAQEVRPSTTQNLSSAPAKSGCLALQHG